MNAKPIALLAALFISGCTSPPPALPTPTAEPPVVPPPAYVVVAATNAMSFAQSVVTPAVGLAADLYEPLVEVSDRGTVYVAAHVAGAATTGTPAYVSNDDGKTWKPLPFWSSLATPPPGQGSALPPGDEGHIVAAPDGRAYMADISLAAFPVEGWCDDGARQCYHNPNAFDRREAPDLDCGGPAVNDRPWAAYANGTLLLVNNPGTGAVQVGVLPVPPADGAGVQPATWNMCAGGEALGFVPGVPALRDDLRFAVPQTDGRHVRVIRGSARDVAQAEMATAFNVTSRDADFGGGPNFGSATFDHEGNLYVAAMNNTAQLGRFAVGLSLDAGATFSTTTFETGGKVGFLYVDGSPRGPGALVSWIQDGDSDATADVYAAHLLPVAGRAVLADATLVADEVQTPCGDVMGSAAGPDGRAYLAVYASSRPCRGTPLENPLSVWIQGPGGAVLP